MDCADTNKDGLLDYTEFTERFHQPAENIGTLHAAYNMCNTYIAMYIHTYSIIHAIHMYNTLLCMYIHTA